VGVFFARPWRCVRVWQRWWVCAGACRRFDTADTNNGDSITGMVTHVMGALSGGTSLTEFYCCTNAASAGTRTGAWGPGSYCMLVQLLVCGAATMS
jgi:hypothetical protein